MRKLLAASLLVLCLVIPTSASAECSTTVHGIDVGFENTHRHRPYYGTKFDALRLRKYTWVVRFTFNDGSTYVHNGNGIYSSTLTVPVPAGATSVTWLNTPTVLLSGRHWGSLFGPELTVLAQTGTQAVTCA
jgi:hypothetical protein